MFSFRFWFSGNQVVVVNPDNVQHDSDVNAEDDGASEDVFHQFVNQGVYTSAQCGL